MQANDCITDGATLLASHEYKHLRVWPVVMDSAYLDLSRG